MASRHGLSTRVLLLLNFLIYGQPLTIPFAIQVFSSFFLLKLLIKCFPFIENLHQLVVDFVTVELLQNVLLVLKLILGLFGLFSTLLLLNQSKRILWLSTSRSLLGLFDSLLQVILTMTLRTLGCYLRVATRHSPTF